MSDYDQHKRNFDYAPPTRGGSGTGALIFIGGLVVLFILALLFMGGGSGTLPEDATAPAVAPTDGAPPVVDPTTPVLVD